MNRLKELMRARGIRQRELAAECHVCRSAVCNWVRDVSLPDIYTALKIADYLKVDLRAIFDYERD